VNETTLEVACVPQDRDTGIKIVQETVIETMTNTRFEADELEIVKVNLTELETAVEVPFAKPCARGKFVNFFNRFKEGFLFC
jgi:hypothetical protein